MKNFILIIIALLSGFACSNSKTHKIEPTKLANTIMADFVKKGNGFFIKEQTLGSKEKWKVFLYPEFADEELFFRFTPNADHKHFSVKDKKELSDMKIDLSKINIPSIHLIPYDKITKKDFSWRKVFKSDLDKYNASGLFILSRPFIDDTSKVQDRYSILISFIFPGNIKTRLYIFQIDKNRNIDIIDTKIFNHSIVY